MKLPTYLSIFIVLLGEGQRAFVHVEHAPHLPHEPPSAPTQLRLAQTEQSASYTVSIRTG
jgi:hypothetical protein